MKFIVSKPLFYSALQKIIGVVPTKTTIPILSNILLELENTTLKLTGTDLEISISTEIKVNAQQEGTIAVPARFLNEIVRELPDLPIEITSDEDNRMTLTTDKGFYKLSGEAKEDFPSIVIEESEGSIEFSGTKLSRMINKTLFAVSTDELRASLMGVYFQVMENEFRLVSTDGHRLVKIADKNFSSPNFQKNAIIPAKALTLLLRNLDGMTEKEDKMVKINFGENHVIFKLDDTSLYSKVIEGKYPKYENVIPVDNDKKLVINKDMLNASVKRVAIFSNSITHQIRFSLAKNVLEIRSEDIEYGGEAKEEISADYTAEDMQIGYNAFYILDILRHIDTEDVVFLLKDPTSAAIIYPSSQTPGEDLMMLLMPIRLNED